MIAISFNLDQAIKDLTDAEKRHVPFAFARAQNDSASESVDQVRTRMYARLSIRQASSRSLFENAIKFSRDGRADSSVGKLTAEVRIVGQAGQHSTSETMSRIGAILIRQDEGGVREGTARIRRGQQFELAGNVIPFAGLRSATRPTPRKIYPVNIGLSPRSRIEGGETFASSYKGGKKKRGSGFKKGTKFYFATDRGIFVREQLNSGESEYDALWWFKRTITLQPRLGFADTFVRTVDATLAKNFDRRLREALRSGR